MKKIQLLLITAAVLAMLTGCGTSMKKKDAAATSTPKATSTATPGASPKSESNTDKVVDDVENVGGDVGDAAKNVGDAVGDTVEGVTDAAGNAVKNADNAVKQ